MTASTTEPALHADVCIVCALAEEGNAVIRMFETYANCHFVSLSFQHGEHTHIYYETSIFNANNQILTIVLSWTETTGELPISPKVDAMLQRFKPRFAAMTGICAGDRRKVKLGDLIIAEKSFKYDRGKTVLDEDGTPVFECETDTKGPSSNIREWLQHFGEWKNLLDNLPRPTSNSCTTELDNSVCHIKAIASGSSVRSDDPFCAKDPFRYIQKPVRTAWAVEMECYAFYYITERFPSIQSLVVKGVCDYADMDKDDSFHNYAGEASALYLLAFIRKFTNDQFMPRHRDLGSTSESKQNHIPDYHNGHPPIEPPSFFIKENAGAYELFAEGRWIEFPINYSCQYDTSIYINKNTLATLINALKISYGIRLHMHTMCHCMNLLIASNSKAVTKHYLNDYINSVTSFVGFLQEKNNDIRKTESEFNLARITSNFQYFIFCKTPLQRHANHLRLNIDKIETFIVQMFLNSAHEMTNQIINELHNVIDSLLQHGDN